MEVASFRLTLLDALLEGGQKAKTFNLGSGDIDGISIESLVDRLNEHFDLMKLMEKRKISKDAFEGSEYLAVVGTDGDRHVPIRSDEQLVSFFKAVANSKLPTIEVKFEQPGAPHLATTLTERSSPHNPQAFIEEAKVVKEYKESIAAEMDLLRKAVKDMEKSNVERDNKVLEQFDQLSQKFERKFEDVQSVLTNVRQGDSLEGREVKGNDPSNSDELNRLSEEVKRLDEMLESKAPKDALQAAEEAMQGKLESKASKADWQAAEEAMSLRIKEELTSVRSEMQSTDASVKGSIEKLQSDIESTSKTLAADCQATTERLNAMMKEVQEMISRDCAKFAAESKQELDAVIKTEIATISSTIDKRFADETTAAAKRGKDLNESVSTMSARTEATFSAMEERMENLVKAERSRLGNMEKDLAESNAKLRSDCRSEVERVRVDYEQEAARLDADLSDLHMKHDVVKQEINFFQSRLLEQRDWAQSQLAETATATRAAQVDSQEGVAACTRMAHALRDDQVSFRDKMAKHISLLQHASDSYGDAINALETQRSRMKLELDAILGDHKSYVMDMDGWADDVRLKVERLFRAMEPPRCEWRIGGAVAKFKDMKKPLSIRSPTFGLQGLREVQMELYPHGTNQSADSKAMLRLCMPPGANVRYQCSLGRLTEGSREYKSGGSLSVDLVFESWKDQVLEDGGLNITMEVFQDLTNNDESLARAVHLET